MVYLQLLVYALMKVIISSELCAKESTHYSISQYDQLNLCYKGSYSWPRYGSGLWALWI